jgi:hypothetical protein
LNKNKAILSYWYYLLHIKDTFSEIEHWFSAQSHSFVDSDRDFRIMEKKKRRQPHVFTAESWYRLVEMASKKSFTVMGMKAKGYTC